MAFAAESFFVFFLIRDDRMKLLRRVIFLGCTSSMLALEFQLQSVVLGLSRDELGLSRKQCCARDSVAVDQIGVFFFRILGRGFVSLCIVVVSCALSMLRIVPINLSPR